MSTKNPRSTRRAPEPNSAPPAPTQSLPEQRAADAAARAIIQSVAPESERLIATIRRSLRKRLPTAHEIVYEYRSWVVISFSPTANGYDGVLAVRADADGVKLYFNRGKMLPDPDKLLRGSATQVRFIPVGSATTLTRPAVTRLIEQAITDNNVPFADTGKGSIVIRSASATKPKPKGRA